MTASKLELQLLATLKESFPEAVGGYLIPDVRLAKKHLVIVDIFLPLQKAVIEYDGYYWHRKRKRADARKAKELLKAGYTVVRVREATLKDSLPSLALTHSRYLELEARVPADFEEITRVIEDFLSEEGE